MTNPAELIDRLGEDPNSLTPSEKYLGALAVLGVMQGPEAGKILGSEIGPRKNQAAEGFVPMLISGLAGIRLDENISEDQKLRYGLRVIHDIDFAQLPEQGQRTKLLAETFLTIAAGSKTAIRQRISDHLDSMGEGFRKISAALLLGGKRRNLAPTEQLRMLYSDLDEITGIDNQGKHDILLAWAKECINQGASESEVANMTNFFFETDDNDAALETTLTQIGKGLASETSIH